MADEAENNPRTLLPRDSSPVIKAIKLSLTWLNHLDVEACSNVCKELRDQIDQDVWKQVARIISPTGVQAMEVMNKKVDYKHAISCLTCGDTRIEPEPPSPVSPEDLPEPKLKVQDLLLIIELKNKETQKIVGTWCQEFGKNYREEGEEPECWRTVFKNPKSTSPVVIRCPTSMVLHKIRAEMYDSEAMNILPCYRSKDFELTLRVLRCDNGKSLCLKTELGHYPFGRRRVPFSTNASKPIAETDEGKTARLLGYCYAEFSIELFVKPIFADPGSNQEPAWLKRMRAGEKFLEWQDCPELQSTEYFEYQIQGFEALLNACFGTNDDADAVDFFESVKECLLFLEGLDWK